MPVSPLSFRASFCPLVLTVLSAGLLSPFALAQVAPALERSTVALGQQPPSTPITGTLWLPMHNKAALDAAVAAMYVPGSPSFHQFANPQALKQFAPTAGEVQSVKTELATHNLSVVSVDAYNFAIQVKGQTSDFEAAFHTVVNQYKMPSGKVMSALATATSLGTVTGISGVGMENYMRHPLDPSTGKAVGPVPANSSQSVQLAQGPTHCFQQPRTITASFPSSAPGGGQVNETWSGLIYQGLPGTEPGAFGACGYTPQDVYTFYGLNTAYKKGYTGQGQTIAIIDAYGSPTIQADLATFNATYGLAPTTSSSFQIIPTAPSVGADAGWAEETTLDVEWAHAIAPGATIKLITTPTESDDDLQRAVLSVIDGHLASVISNSYGKQELFVDQQTAEVWNQLCELAAFEGIAVNFASGDGGAVEPGQQSGDVGVSVPADSPYGTAVGGTSIAFSPFDSSVVETGWGTHLVYLSSPKGFPMTQLADGSGGGSSMYFPKPSHQTSLQGTGRQLPDIAALADPFTGAQMLFTVNGKQYQKVVGGTSLATAVFSAEWALIQQHAGFPLGQAAPYFAQASKTAFIHDVVAPPPQLAVSGDIQSNAGTNYYTAEDLVAPVEGGFTSALYDAGKGNLYAISFGTTAAYFAPPGGSMSRAITQGWDSVTGWGTLDMNAIFAH